MFKSPTMTELWKKSLAELSQESLQVVLLFVAWETKKCETKPDGVLLGSPSISGACEHQYGYGKEGLYVSDLGTSHCVKFVSNA